MKLDAAAAQETGRLGVAAQIWERLAREGRDPAEAVLMLGVVAQQAGNSALALAMFDHAIAIEPQRTAPYYNRAIILRVLGRTDDALASLQQILNREPGLAVGWDLRGQLLADCGAWDEAVAAHRCAIGLDPAQPSFRANQAATLRGAGDLAAACRAGREGERLDPAHPPLALGHSLRGLGYPLAAANIFARLRTDRPADPELAACEAMARLQAGDFAGGWPLWEQRPDLASDPALASLPFWNGKAVGHLLVYEDQGLGDAIQCLRFLPDLARRGLRVTLRVEAALAALCRMQFPAIDVLDTAAPLPATLTARCRLMSLPALGDAMPDKLPAAPYLTATRLVPVADRRIGLIWAGNAANRTDHARSAPLAAFETLLSRVGPHLVSLQKQHRPGDAAWLVRYDVADAAPRLGDFEDAAACIAALDLVITVDTAMAHLAGALGKPVFLLLAFDPDWRWLLARNDSPWYPSVKLYRQTRPGDWQDPIEAVTRDVESFLGGDRDILRPMPWQGSPATHNPDAPMPPP